MYGFTIDVDGTAVKALKQIEDELKKLTTQTQNATQEMKSQFDGLANSLGHVGTVLAEVFAVREIFNFGKELMHLTAEFEGFINVIKYSSIGIVDAGTNLDYVRDSIERLSLPMKETYESFSEMQAGMVGTGIEGEKLRRVFEGVAEASAVMHLNPASFSRTAFALKEIGELGTLQARQLRMLSLALPGSGAIAAQTLKMNTNEMHEAMKSGSIKAEDFLPKFGDALKEQFGKGLKNAGESLISQMNREQTAITKTMLEIGESLRPLFVDILKDIITGVTAIKSIWGSISGDGSFVETLQVILKWVTRLVPIWVTYRTVMFGVNAISKIFTITNGVLTASLGEVTVMVEGTTIATEGLAAAFASTGIGAFVVGIGLAIEKLISMNAELDESIDKKYQLTKSKDDIKSITDQAASIKEQFSVFNQLSTGSKIKLSEDVAEYLKNTREKFPVLGKRQSDLVDSSRALGGAPTSQAKLSSFLFKFGMGAGTGFKPTDVDKQGKVADELSKITPQLKQAYQAFAGVKSIGEALKKQGFASKGYKASKGESGSSVTDSAINVSNLSGGKGGLGEARNVTFIFKDALQKITVQDGRNIKDYGQDAIEMIIRTLNNMSYSQGTTF